MPFARIAPRRSSLKRLAAALLLCTAVPAAVASTGAARNGPSSAGTIRPMATGASIDPISATLDDDTYTVTVSMTVTGTTDDGGGRDSLRLVVYDDYVLKGSTDLTVSIGSATTRSVAVSWEGPIGTVVPGVGIYLLDQPGGATLDFVDPYSPPILTCNVSVAPSSLSEATVGSAYQRTLTASGGTAPYAWKVIGGSLPAGLSLTSSGLLGGTPTKVGSFAFSVEVTDSGGCGGQRNYRLEVACPSIAISPSSLADVPRGVAFETGLSADGGKSPYTFKFVGSAPSGLSLSRQGVLSGTLAPTGVISFQVQATDAQGCTGKRTYTLQPPTGRFMLSAEEINEVRGRQ